MNTIRVMATPEEDVPVQRKSPPARQPGWVALLFVVAIACLVIGGMLLGMMQAPVFPRKLVSVAWVCVAVGVVVILIAWSGRRK